MSYSHVNNDSGLPIEPRGVGCAGGGRQGEAVGAVTKRPGGYATGWKIKIITKSHAGITSSTKAHTACSVWTLWDLVSPGGNSLKSEITPREFNQKKSSGAQLPNKTALYWSFSLLENIAIWTHASGKSWKLMLSLSYEETRLLFIIPTVQLDIPQAQVFPVSRIKALPK